MSFPHDSVVHGLHGTKCDCTLHDIGLNCCRKLTEDSLQRQLEEIVHVACGSGLSGAAIDRAWLFARSKEIP